MQVSKLIVALTVAAGFASASFAQGTVTPAQQAAPATKVVAPVTAEKKVEAPKAAEAAKVEAANAETPKADAGKPAEKHSKTKASSHKSDKHEVVVEGKPASIAPAQAPAAK